MPVPAVIAGATSEFALNTGSLQKAVADLTPEQWLARPSDHSNHVTWIVGLPRSGDFRPVRQARRERQLPGP